MTFWMLLDCVTTWDDWWGHFLFAATIRRARISLDHWRDFLHSVDDDVAVVIVDAIVEADDYAAVVEIDIEVIPQVQDVFVVDDDEIAANKIILMKNSFLLLLKSKTKNKTNKL